MDGDDMYTTYNHLIDLSRARGTTTVHFFGSSGHLQIVCFGWFHRSRITYLGLGRGALGALVGSREGFERLVAAGDVDVPAVAAHIGLGSGLGALGALDGGLGLGVDAHGARRRGGGGAGEGRGGDDGGADEEGAIKRTQKVR